jgi:exodeoxyribonuclease VII small subunit
MPTDPTDATSAELDTLGYAEAVDELEAILSELDGDDVDVDVLAARVRRAADLVQLCRRRLDAARVEVTRIVADLEAVAPLADGGDGGDDGEDPDGGRPSAEGDDPGGLFAAEA